MIEIKTAISYTNAVLRYKVRYHREVNKSRKQFIGKTEMYLEKM